jgi:hypothetical protein
LLRAEGKEKFEMIALMSIGFSFGEMKMFWNQIEVVIYNIVDVLHAINCTALDD